MSIVAIYGHMYMCGHTGILNTVTGVLQQDEGENMGENAVCRNTAVQMLKHLQPAGILSKD